MNITLRSQCRSRGGGTLTVLGFGVPGRGEFSGPKRSPQMKLQRVKLQGVKLQRVKPQGEKLQRVKPQGEKPQRVEPRWVEPQWVTAQ